MLEAQRHCAVTLLHDHKAVVALYLEDRTAARGSAAVRAAGALRAVPRDVVSPRSRSQRPQDGAQPVVLARRAATGVSRLPRTEQQTTTLLLLAAALQEFSVPEGAAAATKRTDGLYEKGVTQLLQGDACLHEMARSCQDHPDEVAPQSRARSEIGKRGAVANDCYADVAAARPRRGLHTAHCRRLNGEIWTGCIYSRVIVLLLKISAETNTSHSPSAPNR